MFDNVKKACIIRDGNESGQFEKLESIEGRPENVWRG
jgi:hypothetical protein